MAGIPQLATRRAQVASRPRLEARDHEAWQSLIVKLCGLELGETRRDFLARRLWQRMGALGLTSYTDYLDRVLRDPQEWRQLLELLINRETRFFRHPPSFEALRHVLTQILRRGAVDASSRPSALGDSPRLKLWSAGCSTGQELFSMAICALDVIAASGIQATVRVTGGDVSEQSFARVREGCYTDRQMATVSSGVRRRYFRREDTSRGQRFHIRRSLREVMRLVPWNLSRPESYLPEPQDVIFCQNLLIYVPLNHRPKVVSRLSDCLRPGGYLFLAPGEALGLHLASLEAADLPNCLAYRRTA